MDRYDGLTCVAKSEIVVWVHEKCANPVEIIIHESVHVFQKICTILSETEPSDEFEAYTIAHIATTLLEKRRLDAVYDERKTRLQEGVCEVPGQAGANQGEVGTLGNEGESQQ